MSTVIRLPLPRGTCPTRLFGDLGGAPIVLLFMDAFGPRPALFDIAERFQREGYAVLLPNLFYHHLPFDPIDPAKMFAGIDNEQERLMGMFLSLTQEQIDADVNALLAFATERGGAAPAIACVGYCMGGRYALTAAAASDTVAFAASLHGSVLAPETEDGPHRRLSGLKSRLYIGVAGIDPMFEAAEEGRLAAALRAGDVDHIIETYAGANHGFTMNDLPIYNADAAERHLLRVTGHMKEMFASRGCVPRPG